MQVKCQRSRFLRKSNRTRENKDGRREGKKYTGIANSEKS